MDRAATPAERRRVLLIEDFVDVSRPLDEVSDCFSSSGNWLAPLISAAEEDGEAVRLRIGPSWAGEWVSREVSVTLGPTRDRGDAIVIPVAWEAVGMRALLPALDGDLELAPIGPGQCRLTLAASYSPPFGELGRSLDRALLHRVAASTIRSFLSRVAGILEGCQDGPAGS